MTLRELLNSERFKKIPPSAIKVFVYLNYVFQCREFHGWEPIRLAEISEETGISLRTIYRAMKNLELYGLIKIDRSKCQNEYKIDD